MLRLLAGAGRAGQLAILQQGGAAAMLAAMAAPAEPASWRRRCLLVVHSLLGVGDVEMLKSLLAAGLLHVLLALASDLRSDRPLQLLVLHQLGALTWRCNSSALRASLTAELKTSGAAQSLIEAARAHPGCVALRVGAIKMLLEVRYSRY